MAGNIQPTFSSGLRIKIPKNKVGKPNSSSNFIDFCSDDKINELNNKLKENGLTNWRVNRSINKRPGECYFLNIVTNNYQFEFPTENLPKIQEVSVVPKTMCGAWGCFGRGGSKRTRKNKKRKSRTIKRRR